MSKILKVRRDIRANIPVQLALGEFGFATDTKEVFIGGLSGNIKVGMSDENGFINASIYKTDSNDWNDAIQTAIANHDKVVLSNGEFIINDAITFDKDQFILKGSGNTVLKKGNVTTDIIRSVPSERVNIVGSLSNILIQDIVFNGVDKSVNGIRVSGFTRACKINNCKFLNCDNGLELAGSWSFTVEQNNFNDCVVGCYFGQQDSEAHSNGSKLVNAVQFVGNVVRNCDTAGVKWDGNGNHIAGNTIELNDGYGLWITNTNMMKVTSNYFEKNGVAHINLGDITEGRFAYNCNIDSNIFETLETGVLTAIRGENSYRVQTNNNFYSDNVSVRFIAATGLNIRQQFNDIPLALMPSVSGGNATRYWETRFEVFDDSDAIWDANWSNRVATDGQDTPQLRALMSQDGRFVTLVGQVKASALPASGDVILTLPDRYKPERTLYFPALTGSTPVVNGTIELRYTGVMKIEYDTSFTRYQDALMINVTYQRDFNEDS